MEAAWAAIRVKGAGVIALDICEGGASDRQGFMGTAKAGEIMGLDAAHRKDSLCAGEGRVDAPGRGANQRNKIWGAGIVPTDAVRRNPAGETGVKIIFFLLGKRMATARDEEGRGAYFSLIEEQFQHGFRLGAALWIVDHDQVWRIFQRGESGIECLGDGVGGRRRGGGGERFHSFRTAPGRLRSERRAVWRVLCRRSVVHTDETRRVLKEEMRGGGSWVLGALSNRRGLNHNPAGPSRFLQDLTGGSWM